MATSSCSLINADYQDNQFLFIRRWVRHTPTKDYVGYRISHVMEPVIAGNLVIAGNEFDGIRAYNKLTGQDKWKRYINGGVTASARLYDGTVYFGAGDGYFYALDARTGRTQWRFPIRSEGIGAPLVTPDTVYFLTGTNSAYAVDRKTGNQIWVYPRQDSASITVRGASEPTLIGDKLYAGFSDGFLVALDKARGTMVWEKQLNSAIRFRDVDAKPVLDNGRLYVSSYDGQLFCLDEKTGHTIWTDDQGGFTPVTIVGNRIYYSTSTRMVQALDKVSGKVLWSLNFKDTVATQPVYYRGLVLFGEWDGPLVAVNARTGKTVAQFITGIGVTAMPTIDPKTSMVYLNTRDANLFALKMSLRSPMKDWPWISH